MRSSSGRGTGRCPAATGAEHGRQAAAQSTMRPRGHPLTAGKRPGAPGRLPRPRSVVGVAAEDDAADDVAAEPAGDEEARLLRAPGRIGGRRAEAPLEEGARSLELGRL